MKVKCKQCGRAYDDADRITVCPHELIMSADNLAQKQFALDLIGRDICFAHLPDGPSHRIQSVNWNGMVTLHDMSGEFAPHLFILASTTAK